MTNLPAVSVIIPMYNAERFVGQCLESLLAQTFQVFEVIIADDCSTDSSCAVVESFAPLFNGRLKLVHTEKNSGGCAVPRNVGFKFARGEYVYSIDADDLLTLTALEELYTLAKDYDADVVYCEKHYEATHDLSRISICSYQSSFVDRPMLATESLPHRVKNFVQGEIEVTAWVKFIRRKLLVEHNLSFPPCKISEDFVWTVGLLCYAKRFLHVPNVVYVYRQSDNSIMRKAKSPQELINFWLDPIVRATKQLGDMLSKLEFFRRNPKYHYAILKKFIHFNTMLTVSACVDLPAFEICEIIRDSFGKEFGEQDMLMSWLLTDFIMRQKDFVDEQKRLGLL